LPAQEQSNGSGNGNFKGAFAIAFTAARGEYDEIGLEVEIKEHWIDAVFWETVDGV
jgi:hypothetical protein